MTITERVKGTIENGCFFQLSYADGRLRKKGVYKQCTAGNTFGFSCSGQSIFSHPKHFIVAKLEELAGYTTVGFTAATRIHAGPAPTAVSTVAWRLADILF